MAPPPFAVSTRRMVRLPVGTKVLLLIRRNIESSWSWASWDNEWEFELLRRLLRVGDPTDSRRPVSPGSVTSESGAVTLREHPGRMPNGHAWSTSRRALRYRLTLLLRREGRPMSLGDLAAALDRAGWPAPEPATKSISDSLRWEVGKGRVIRVSRGRYATGRLDRRTAWWLQRQLDEWESVDRLSESSAVHLGGTAEPVSFPDRPSEAPAWLRALRPETVDRLSESRDHPAA